MPFDFKNYKVYEIDYDTLFHELNEERILSDHDLQTDHLNRWMEELKQQDETLKQQFNTQNSIAEYIKKQTGSEIFQKPMYFKSNTVYFHFQSTKARASVQGSYSQSMKLPFTCFEGDGHIFYWSKAEENVEGYADNNDPIVAVPYRSNEKYNFIVIDGNHQLTYRVRHKKVEISVLFISEKSVIELDLCSSSFDKMFYTFHNELHRFASLTEKGDFTDRQLLDKSYLMGKGFQFGTAY